MSERDSFDNAVRYSKHFDSYAFEGARLVGHARAILGNEDVPRAIGGSLAGAALKLYMDSFFESCVLYICRYNENNGVSITGFCRRFLHLEEDIKASRKKKKPYWSDEDLGIAQVGSRLSAVHRIQKSFLKHGDYQRVKLFRDENVAHSLQGKSANRRKWEVSFGYIGSPQYNSIVSCLEHSVKQFTEIFSLYHFSTAAVANTMSREEKTGREFWKLLPCIRDIEDGR